MSVRFAMITDVHYSLRQTVQNPSRCVDIALHLFRRAIEYLNIRGGIDLVCVGGDLLNCPEEQELLSDIQSVLERSIAPTLVIPGNHDPKPERFYQTIKYQDYVDVKGVRFIPFVDEERAGYNAFRSVEQIERGRKLCHDFAGPKVFLQHVPLCPKEVVSSYKYLNASEMIPHLKEDGVVMCLSGHEHRGIKMIEKDGCTFAVEKSLCDAPFVFTIFTLNEDGSVEREPIQLQLPNDVDYSDYHTHSAFAYCNQNVDPVIESRLMDVLHLGHVAVTEHTRHLYLREEQCRALNSSWYRKGFADASAKDNRTAAFLQYMKEQQMRDPRFISGVEVDVAASGEIIMRSDLRDNVKLRIGAIHAMSDGGDHPGKKFIFLCRHLFEDAQVRILAHPFRIFAWSKIGAVPVDSFAELIALMKKYNVAAEINFHKNTPNPKFFQMCLESGVKIALGSDTHNLYELGFFNPHFDFLKSIGFSGDLNDILFDAQC